MTLLPGIRHHSHYCEVDTRFATAESLSAARDYSAELCGAEEWFDPQVLLICLNEAGNPRCESGSHGFARVMERVEAEGLSMGIQQEASQ